MQKILVIPDVHIPFEHEPSWRLMLRVGKELKPDRIILLGDVIDAYSVNSHGGKSLDRGQFLIDEIEKANHRLDEVQALGAKRVDYIEANHETRVSRYISDKAPELFGIVTVPKLLRIKERAWVWTSYRKSLKVGSMRFVHDVGIAGVNAAAKSRDVFGTNVCIGHVHNINVSYSGNLKNETHVGISLGWLGDPEKVDYLNQANVAKNWTHGCGVAYHDDSTGIVYISPVPFINGTAMLNGKVLRAN